MGAPGRSTGFASLAAVELTDPVMVAARERVRSILKSNLRRPAVLLETYRPFISVMESETEAFGAAWREAGHPLDEVRCCEAQRRRWS